MAVHSDCLVNQLPGVEGLLGAGDRGLWQEKEPLVSCGAEKREDPWALCSLSGTPGELMNAHSSHWCEFTNGWCKEVRQEVATGPDPLRSCLPLLLQ